jgi:hypothetical protein
LQCLDALFVKHGDVFFQIIPRFSRSDERLLVEPDRVFPCFELFCKVKHLSDELRPAKNKTKPSCKRIKIAI